MQQLSGPKKALKGPAQGKRRRSRTAVSASAILGHPQMPKEYSRSRVRASGFLAVPHSPLDWTGLYCAVATQFGGDGALDAGSLRSCIAALVEAGVDGIVVLDSVGEASTLEPAEKLAVIQSAAAAASGRVPVIASLGEATTSAALRFAEAAERAGADGLIVRQPLDYRPSVEEFAVHSDAIASATTLPLMVDTSHCSAGRADLGELLDRLEPLASVGALRVKGWNERLIGELKRRLGERYRFVCDSDDQALHALSLGADGWLSAIAYAVPAEAVSLYQRSVWGELADALELYTRLIPLLDLVDGADAVQVIKLASALAGRGTEHVRRPRMPLVDVRRSELETALRLTLAQRGSGDQGIRA
jgi:1-pyrroline-4-hydroxy-2-carboxylate deaminase